MKPTTTSTSRIYLYGVVLALAIRIGGTIVLSKQVSGIEGEELTLNCLNPTSQKGTQSNVKVAWLKGNMESGESVVTYSLPLTNSGTVTNGKWRNDVQVVEDDDKTSTAITLKLKRDRDNGTFVCGNPGPYPTTLARYEVTVRGLSRSRKGSNTGNTDNTNKNKVNIGVVVGATVGCVIVAVVIAIFVFLLLKRRGMLPRFLQSVPSKHNYNTHSSPKETNDPSTNNASYPDAPETRYVQIDNGDHGYMAAETSFAVSSYESLSKDKKLPATVAISEANIECDSEYDVIATDNEQQPRLDKYGYLVLVDDNYEDGNTVVEQRIGEVNKNYEDV